MTVMTALFYGRLPGPVLTLNAFFFWLYSLCFVINRRFYGVKHIFVYGTLKRGYRLASFMDGQFLGEATTVAEYRLFNVGSFPGLVETSPGVEIVGEVWAVSNECLAVLDEVEAVDEGMYRRSHVHLQPPFNELAVESYFYLKQTDGLADCGSCW